MSVITVKAEAEDPFFAHIHPPSANCSALQDRCGLSGSTLQNPPWEICYGMKQGVQENTAIVRKPHRGFNPALERLDFFFF